MGVFPDDNTDETSSNSSTLDEVKDLAPQEQDTSAAAPSPAEGENEGKDTLSVVRDVVGKNEPKTEPAAASPAEGSETGEPASDPSTDKEVDDENFSDVPFHKHPRFKALIEQRNGLREDATRYRNVQTFIDDNGLTGEEAANILVSAAKAKTDPVACLNEIRPWLQKLLIAAGEVLPDDLAARVQSGDLTHEAAIELSRANARVNSVTATQSFQQQQAAVRAHSEREAAKQQVAASWENDRKLKDPNFETKYPLILKELKLIQYDEGKPDTPRGVQEQLERAYKAANESFRPPVAAVAPARKPIRPVTGGQVNGAAQGKPETTLDIVRAARQARAS